MDEKTKEILENYSLDVYSAGRSKSGMLCQTGQGLKLLREYTYSTKHLVFDSMIKYIIRDRGYMHVDQLVANKQGELYVTNKYNRNFTIRDWYDGRECDMHSHGDLMKMSENLARLHKVMGQVHLQGEGPMQYFHGGYKDIFERHNREMKSIYNYMCNRKKKNAFEKLYLKEYALFYAQGKQAVELLEKSDGYQRLLDTAIGDYTLCHGDYNQHNVILMKNGDMATVNFKTNVNIQVNDLYLFLRKVMEKNQWNGDLAMDIVEAYDKEKHLDADARRYLYVLMLYPEKFWKIANRYYNSRKSWTSAQNLEKLEKYVENKTLRERFLGEFKHVVSTGIF